MIDPITSFHPTTFIASHVSSASVAMAHLKGQQ
jgi:hypothetical protein